MLTDRDILTIEPNLFSDGCFTSQKLCGGTNGIAGGTQFTSSGVDFNALGVAAGHVIWLESVDGVIEGWFEIVSLIDSTHLTVSILRSDASGSAISMGAGSGLTWRIKTFTPQIALIETALSYRLRCLPGWEAATVALSALDNADAVKLIWLYLLLGEVFGSMVGTCPAYTADSAAAAWNSHREKCVRYQKKAELLIRQL